MSKDAQDKAREGQSPATATDDASGWPNPGPAESAEAAGEVEPRRSDEEPQVEAVAVRFEHAFDGVTEQLDADGYRLRRGETVSVPREVFERLQSGDNALLYRVVQVDEEGGE